MSVEDIDSQYWSPGVVMPFVRLGIHREPVDGVDKVISYVGMVSPVLEERYSRTCKYL